jgi:hypothetical protein
MNFNDHTVTWDTDTIPMKDRDTALYHPSVPDTGIVYMSANEPENHKSSEMNILKLPKF